MLASPAWLAVIVQVPVAIAVIVAPLVPLTVHLVGVVLANRIGLLDAPPVAVMVSVPPTWKGVVAAGFRAVMVWSALVMVKLSLTWLALSSMAVESSK